MAASPMPHGDDDLSADLIDALGDLLLVDGAERDAALRALLAAHPAQAVALRRAVDDICGAEQVIATTFADAVVATPARIGRYHVIRCLGEGAFGTVFLCREEQPVRREVAVKLLRPGVGDRTTLARFERERQLLASLSHPTIPKILDAGVHDDGRPYFVTESIDGIAVTSYADRRGLSLRARLELFVEICRGVQHAHAHGIVHRDLKPANILVTEHDERPSPRLIDFGIAKVLATEAVARPDSTEGGRVVGTPGYMSPEQARGDQADVDARADVYALGVVLHELLVGDRPWRDTDTTGTREPARPSTRVTSDPKRTASIAECRATEPGRLVRSLRGDLDWIVLKALQPAPEQRYPTAQALAEDVGRHLAGVPVAAGPPSVRYRLRKFVRRNRVSLGWSAVVVVLVVAGTAAALHFRGLAIASESARIEQARVAVERLYVRATDPRMAEAPDDVRQALLADAVALQQQTIGEQVERVDLREQRVDVLLSLCTTQFLLGQYRECVEVARAARDEATALVALEPSLRHRLQQATADRERGRASFLAGDHPQARAASTDAVAELESLRSLAPGVHDGLLAKALVELASSLGRTGDPDGQVAAQRRAIEVLDALCASRPDDSALRDRVRFRCGLANVLLRRGDVVGAEATLEAARGMAEAPEVTDDERALVAFRLAKLLAAQQRPAEAIAAAESALAAYLAVLDRHPGRAQEQGNVLLLRGLLGEQAAQLGDLDRAAAEAAHVLDGAPSLGRELRWQVAESLVQIAGAVRAASDFDDRVLVAEWLAQAVELLRDVPATSSSRVRLTLDAEVLRGAVRGELGRPLSVAAWRALRQRAVALGGEDALPTIDWQLSLRCLAEGDVVGARAAFDACGTPPVAAWASTRHALAIDAAAGAWDAVRARCDAAWSSATEWRLRAVLAAASARRAAVVPDGREAIARCTAVQRELAAGAASDVDLRRIVTAELRLWIARLGGDPVRDPAVRDAALIELDALRGSVPVAAQDEVLWFDAHVRQLDELRPADGAAVLARFATALRGTDAMLSACAVLAELDADGRAAALALLRRALEQGAAGRRWIAESPMLSALHAEPEFQALVATIPD